MRARCLIVLVLVSAGLVFSGCDKQVSETPTLAAPTLDTFESPFASPLSALQSPLPLPKGREITPFELDKPIAPGAQKVTGVGPADVPVMVIDITSGGLVYGTGVTGKDGSFEISLLAPLEADHRIGITLGDLAGTGLQAEQFYSKGFHGDEALTVPQIGFFFDTGMVRD